MRQKSGKEDYCIVINFRESEVTPFDELVIELDSNFQAKKDSLEHAKAKVSVLSEDFLYEDSNVVISTSWRSAVAQIKDYELLFLYEAKLFERMISDIIESGEINKKTMALASLDNENNEYFFSEFVRDISLKSYNHLEIPVSYFSDQRLCRAEFYSEPGANGSRIEGFVLEIDGFMEPHTSLYINIEKDEPEIACRAKLVTEALKAIAQIDRTALNAHTIYEQLDYELLAFLTREKDLSQDLKSGIEKLLVEHHIGKTDRDDLDPGLGL